MGPSSLLVLLCVSVGCGAMVPPVWAEGTAASGGVPSAFVESALSFADGGGEGLQNMDLDLLALAVAPFLVG